MWHGKALWKGGCQHLCQEVLGWPLHPSWQGNAGSSEASGTTQEPKVWGKVKFGSLAAFNGLHQHWHSSRKPMPFPAVPPPGGMDQCFGCARNSISPGILPRGSYQPLACDLVLKRLYWNSKPQRLEVEKTHKLPQG